jgi:hypothetical protein
LEIVVRIDELAKATSQSAEPPLHDLIISTCELQSPGEFRSIRLHPGGGLDDDALAPGFLQRFYLKPMILRGGGRASVSDQNGISRTSSPSRYLWR